MSSTTTTLNHHGTDPELYDALVRIFGETVSEHSRWATVNAGPVTLTFFAQRPAPVSEPVVRDPESWQAVAAEGRRFA